MVLSQTFSTSEFFQLHIGTLQIFDAYFQEYWIFQQACLRLTNRRNGKEYGGRGGVSTEGFLPDDSRTENDDQSRLLWCP